MRSFLGFIAISLFIIACSTTSNTSSSSVQSNAVRQKKIIYDTIYKDTMIYIKHYKDTTIYTFYNVGVPVDSPYNVGRAVDSPYYVPKPIDSPYTVKIPVDSPYNVGVPVDSPYNVGVPVDSPYTVPRPHDSDYTVLVPHYKDTTIYHYKDTIIYIYDTVHITPKSLIGVMINSEGATTNWDKPSMAKDSLHVTVVRDGINFAQWNGKDAQMEAWRNKGIKVYLNVTYRTCPTDPCPYPTSAQIPIIITNVEDCIKKYGDAIAYLVAPNEPFNKNYWSNWQDRTDYNNLLIALCQLAKKYNIPCVDGGLYNETMEILTYRWLKKNGRQSAVDSIKTAMSLSAIKQADNNGFDTVMARRIVNDSLTMMTDAQYANSVNLHIYYDSTKATQKLPQVQSSLIYIKQYVVAMTTKPLISNETGVRNNNDNNTSPDAVTGIMQVFRNVGVDMIFFSGNHGGAGSQGLFNDDGTMKQAGDAFRDYIDRNN